MKVTPRQIRKYLQDIKTYCLNLKRNIEVCEFEIEQNQCPQCHEQLTAELEMLCEINNEYKFFFKNSLPSIENYLAEDEILNGWKGENRTIELGE